ncbi:YlbF family regulator [Desulfotomaculum sp. 1211_IL3151]|uniref:YlbF family regulator n=1 Tax=Desulfotomaculum sp. 1211_IL3151 TaxID=3084055 RepID=UPI002FDA4D99
MSNVILEKALELGKLIAQSEQYKTMREKEAMMMSDVDALALIEGFQQLQQSHHMLRMQGKELSDEQLNEVYAVEDKMMGNNLIREFAEIQEKFQKFLNQVNDQISEGIEGPRQPQGCNCGTGSFS